MMVFLRVFIIVGVLVFSTKVAAQGIIGGAKLGLAFSSLEASGDEQFPVRVGLNSGLLLQVASSDLFALHTEFCFARHGGKGSRKLISSSDSLLRHIQLKLDYIEVPLLARFTIGETVRLSAYSGFLMGFLIGLQEQYTSFTYQHQQWKPISSGKSRDRTSYQDSNIGWIIGSSVEYNNAFLEFRYTRGFSDIYRPSDWRLKIKTFYFTGGYVLYF